MMNTGAHYTWFRSNNKDLRKMTVQNYQAKKAPSNET